MAGFKIIENNEGWTFIDIPPVDDKQENKTFLIELIAGIPQADGVEIIHKDDDSNRMED